MSNLISRRKWLRNQWTSSLRHERPDEREKNFNKYFPHDNFNLEWIKNPFSESLDGVEDKEEFIDLTCDSNMKDAFKR